MVSIAEPKLIGILFPLAHLDLWTLLWVHNELHTNAARFAPIGERGGEGGGDLFQPGSQFASHK